MPLAKQPLSVDLTGGLDTRTDEKLVVPGKLLASSNLRREGGTLAKRYGCEALGNAVAVTGGTLAPTQGLSLWRGRLLRWAGYAPQAAPWALGADGRWGGASRSANFYRTRKTPVVRNAPVVRGYDVASANGYTVVAWQEYDGASYTVRCMVLDEATNTVVLPATLVQGSSFNGIGPRLVATPSGAHGAVPHVVCVWTEGGDVYSAQMRMDTPLEFDTFRLERTDAYVPGFAATLDVVAVGAALEVVYPAAAGGYTLFTADAGTGAQTNIVNTAGGSTRLSLLRFSNGTLGVLYADGAGLFMRRHDAAHAPTAPADTVFGGGAAEGAPAYVSTDGGATYRVYCHLVAGTTVRHLHAGTATAAGAAGGVAKTGVRPVAQPAVVSGRVLLPVAYTPVYATGTTEVQPTAYLLDMDTLHVSGRALEGVHVPLAADGLILAPALPHTLSAGAVARVYLLEKGRLVLEGLGGSRYAGSFDRTAAGVTLLEVEALTAADVARVELGGLLHVGGACPHVYDGSHVSEAGFHAFPQGLSVADSATAGSLTPGATYSFCAVYEWTDAAGNRHQSAPSPPVQHTVTGPATSVDVTGPMLGLTQRFGSGTFTPPNIVVYRTQAGGTVFYRDTSVTAPIPNDTTVTRWTENVGLLGDATIAANEVLYTTGGALEFLPPPAHTSAWVHQGRLWLAGLEDRQEVRYSGVHVEGEGLLFSDTFTFRVPEDKGEAVGGASMDGRCVVFAERGVGVISGEGPNLLGQQNGYSDIQWLLTDVGCTDWRTIVEVPAGFLFQSARGIHLLTRGLEVQYVGADVEVYNGLTLTRAVRLDDRREVRFLSASGPTLVYDYEYGTWGTHSYGAADAVVQGGRLVRTDGTTVLREDPTRWDDAGEAYGWSFRTSWLAGAGRQGWQRVWRVLLLGSLASAASLVGRLFTRYRGGTASETFSAALDTATHEDGVLHLSHHVAHQQCEALAVEVEVQPSTTEGAAFTNLTLETGVSKPVAKLRAARTA